MGALAYAHKTMDSHALARQVMSEKTALRSRLESESIRNADLQNQVARLHAARALVTHPASDLELGSGLLSEPVITHKCTARDRRGAERDTHAQACTRARAHARTLAQVADTIRTALATRDVSAQCQVKDRWMQYTL